MADEQVQQQEQVQQTQQSESHSPAYWGLVAVAMGAALTSCYLAFQHHFNYQSPKSRQEIHAPGTIEEKVGPGYKLEFRKVNE